MPWAAIIPALISAGGSIAAAKLAGGGGSTGGSTPANFQGLFDDLQFQGDRSSKWAKQEHKQFRNALDPVSEWFRSILSGDRTALMSVLGPEVGGINRSYDAVSKAISQFSPRGGGRNQTMANVDFSKAHDIGDLFSKARPAAAAGLEGVASIYGAQASNDQSQNLGALSTILSGQLGLRAQDIQKLIADRQFGGLFGASIGKLLVQILRGRLPGGGNGLPGTDVEGETGVPGP